MSESHRPWTAAALAACFWLAGCSSTFHAPPGFAELDDEDSYDHRATTADGLVIATRELDNDPKAGLDFWLRAIENELRLRGGYALLEQRDLTAKSGARGKELRFGHDEGQTAHLYRVAVFVDASSIHLIEAGGTREQVEKHAAQIDWAMKNQPLD